MSLPSEISCQFPGCEFNATNASEQVALAMFQSHLLSHQPGSGSNNNVQRLPPIPRPMVKQDISEEDWALFLSEWKNFKRCTNIPASIQADQLYHCCEQGLAKLIVREQPEIVSQGEAELLAAIKRLAVIKIAISVRRTNLLASKQSHGEPVREFYANIKAAAAACKYDVNCIHACCAEKAKIDYTSNVVKDVLIVGIADAEIQKDLLSWEELDSKNDKEVLAFIESKEIAQAAINKAMTTGTAGLSAYRKAQKKPDEQKNLAEQKHPADQSLRSKLSLKGKCAKCKKDILLFKRYQSGNVNKTAFTHCRSCHQSTSQSTKADTSGVSADVTTSSVESFFIGGLECPGKDNGPVSSVPQLKSDVYAITLDHHIFTQEGWQRVSALSHPTLRLRMTTHREDYQQFGISYPSIAPKHVDVVTDS